ncbi:MAG: chorismate-binding protein [Flavobacteriales bacterium]|nr:chorismate-binding protein [Flavobacteriales bacterium]
MKGYFFYQEPEEDKINGFQCTVSKVRSVSNASSGFIVSSFLKDLIYHLSPVKEVGLEVLNDLEFKTDDKIDIGFLEYKEVIERAICFCKENDGKVVVSRTRSIPLNSDFSLREYFVELCTMYHHSFNYCFHLEDGTTWIGATPEVLVKGKASNYTVFSLAGTRSIEDSFEWTDKEKQEQQMVTDEITSCLNNLELSYVLNGPTTVRAGNLEHLLTEFKVQTEDVLGLADSLHPTPAICGLPRDKAKDFILNNELHDRNFYSGIIGRLSASEVSLYVNLRCAEIRKGSIKCYVGGGITTDSDPEKEWRETNYKSNTLLSVLKKN